MKTSYAVTRSLKHEFGNSVTGYHVVVTGRNHAQIKFTTREMGADGLGAKTGVLNDETIGPQALSHMRAYAADHIDEARADSGSDERVDHRSFKDRGIDA